MKKTKNEEFLEIIRQSFKSYLEVNSSRSTAKLKILHGGIADDLKKIYGDEFSILSQNPDNNKEGSIDGRYYVKKIDITVFKDNKPVAGYAIKFVMRNYSQNGNNYFEGMLGETANIRACNIPYFQIFILFDNIPYYKKGGELSKYEVVSKEKLDKYFILSKDNPEQFFHTPDKTLLVLLSLKEKSKGYKFVNSSEYAAYYKSVIDDEDLLVYSQKIKDESFDNTVIFNDYENFLNRTYYIVKGKCK